MKKTFLTVLLLLVAVTLTAQNNAFYYYKGKQKQLSVDKSKVNVFMTTSFQKSSVNNLTTKDFDLKDQPVTQEKWATIDFGSQLNDIEFVQKVNALRNNPDVVGIGYHYKAKGSETVGTSNLFYIKLKKVEDLPLLQQQAVEKNVVVLNAVSYDPTWYCLKTTRNSTKTSVELANQFYETGLFAEIDPAFILRFVNTKPIISNTVAPAITTSGCTNDPSFGGQWGLDNPSNPAVDINACQAWAIAGATGSGAKVAVVDTGIKLNHPDLIDNVTSQGYDSNSQTSPSRFTELTLYPPYYIGTVAHYYKANHGMHVSGIIGARGNNNREVSGVAPQCNIIGVSNNLDSASGSINTSISLGNGIFWAVDNGQTDIVNCSWYCPNINVMNDLPFSTSVLETAITNALNSGRNNKGAIIVFASGNNGQYMSYPAYFDSRLMVVGATNNLGQRAPFSDYENYSIDGETINYNNIDVMAPGVDIRSLTINDLPPPPADTGNIALAQPGPNDFIDQRVLSGTSMAAPHVSGLAALMLSVNPCLTGQQVRDIIEQTCQKVGGYNYMNTAGRSNGTWNNQMGYGLIDAYAATQMAKDLYTPFDLYVKDDIADLGIQPNPSTNVWDSPDIWVRNQQDNIQIHQTPICYPTGQTNFVYVKIRNKGCNPTTGLETVQLYQSTTSTYTNPDMPEARRANIPSFSNITNTLIGTVAIPAGLTAGQEAILKFSWQVPFPNFLPTPGGLEAQGLPTQSFNLLAKIVTPSDPLAVAETPIAYTNIKNNNNIAGKSIVSITKLGSDLERVSVGNPFDEARIFKLELIKEDAETGKPIYEEAEVSIKMDDVLFAAWERGGKQEQNLEQTADNKKQIVENNRVLIDNIQLNAHEEGFVNLSFSFLTAELTDKSQYKYHIIQRDKATNEIIGGVTYQINKDPRPIFVADAGDDKEIDINETITISAEQISEPAIYNWYDSEGNLVFTGKDLTIATNVAEKYKLEVIATADGFKDYSEVEVKLKPSVLSAIAPNPATDNVTIGYKINEGGSAYLMILGGYGTNSASNNYIINPELGEININLANYSSGFYTVALIVNGQIIDAKTLVKE
jgi:serine protease